MDAGGYNKNAREGNLRLGMGLHRGVEKKNRFALGTERCENTRNLYINKNFKEKFGCLHRELKPNFQFQSLM